MIPSVNLFKTEELQGRRPVERTGNGVFVTIPEIGARNAGYIDFSVGRTGGVK